MKSSEQMTIGELAQKFSLATHVLRHWESMGLLSPARGGGGRRRYDRNDLYRVAVIMRAKEAGLGLDAIREMIAASGPAARRAALERQRTELRHRLAQIQASVDLIDGALNCDHDDFTQCAHFQAVVAQRIGGSQDSALACPT